MTSQINYAAITTSYPVAGQDNDSQGFRDNFTAISAGLATAKTEISALQTNAVLVADLSAGTAVVNNLLGSTLNNGLYNQFYGVYFDTGTVAASTNIDLSNGALQKVRLAGNATLTFTNWPSTNKFASVRVIFFSDQQGVRYPILSTANSGTIQFDASFPLNPITSTPGFALGGESVSSIAVVDPGSGFTSNTTVNITGGTPLSVGSVSATAAASYLVRTAVVSGTGTSPGTGYAVGDTLTLIQNTSAIFTVASITATYPVSTAVVSGTGTSPGTGYAVGDTLTLLQNTSVVLTVATITGGGGTGPIGTLTVTTAGSFNSQIGTTSGLRLQSLTGNGSGAAGIFTYGSALSVGPIATLNVSPGGEFLTPIGVTSGLRLHSLTGNGSGAAVIFTFGIANIYVINPGNGYTVAPTVTFTGGSGSFTAPNPAVATITSNTSTHGQVIEAWTDDGGANVNVRYLGEYASA